MEEELTDEEVGRQYKVWAGMKFMNSTKEAENSTMWKKYSWKVICGIHFTLQS